MESKLFFGDAIAFATSALTVFAVDTQTEKDADPKPALLTTSREIETAAQSLLVSGEFKASLGEVAVLHAPAGIKAERLLIVGMMRPEEVDERHPLTSLLLNLRSSGQATEITLGPLTLAETAALAAQVTEHSLAGKSARKVVNPFERCVCHSAHST